MDEGGVAVVWVEEELDDCGEFLHIQGGFALQYC